MAREAWKWWVGWGVALALLVPFVLTARFLPDEFIFVNDARRIAAGEVIGRDFFQFVMPGSFMLTGLVFKLFGPSLLAARALQAMVVAATAVIYTRLARAVGAGRWLALAPAAVVIAVVMGEYYYFGHRWFSQAGIALSLAAAWWAVQQPRARRWGVVGLAAGLAYAMQQLDGMADLAGLAAGIAWLGWRQGWPVAKLAKRLGVFLLGWAAPLGLLALYLLAHGALAQELWATHVWAVMQYRAPGNHNDIAYATDLGFLLSTASGWISLPYWYASTAVLLVGTFFPLVASFVAACWLVGLGRRAAGRESEFLGLVALVAIAGFAAALRGRADAFHLLATSLPQYLLATAAVARWEELAREPAARGLRYAPRLLLAGFVGAGALRVIELARHDPAGWRVWGSPDARIQAHPSFAAIARRLHPGDTLFAGAHAGMYNFYLAPNPTRFDYWVRPENGYTTPAQFAEILADVRARRPRLLVIAATTQAEADASIHELLDAYHPVETLPHPLPTWKVPLHVYVYERS